MGHDPRTLKPRRGFALLLAAVALLSLALGIIVGLSGWQPNGSVPLLASLGILGEPAVTNGKPLEPTPVLEPVCFDTCFKAKDGVCDDGRPKEGEDPSVRRNVVCDLGTDCRDCGPWVPSARAPWLEPGGVPGPVARLREKEVEVRVKRSFSNPPFLFAYTNPAADFDVSNNYEHGGLVEGGITKLFYQIFKDKCVPPAGGRPSLFVDVGSNFGWFSLLAASMGCRAVAFEPVPHFFAFLEYSVHANGLAHRVDMRQTVVSAEPSRPVTMTVPNRGIWGTASIGGSNIDKSVESVNTNITVPSVRLDDVIKEKVLLLKVDVEGWEWSVMQGAEKLLRNRAVENIIMEYSPGVPERHFNFLHMKLTVEMLMALIKHGFRIGHIGDMNKHEGSDWDSQLGSLEEVTLGNLVYDRHDVDLWEKDTLGCPLDESLLMFQGWGRFGCGRSLPEDVSPFSLRSMIGHNTNLWASTSDHLLPLGGTVGIIDLGQDLKNDFFGMGSRICKDLPAMVQVRHRCHCSHEECQAEEAAVAAVSAAGRMAANYQLPSPEKDPRSVKMTCKCVGAECTC